MLNLTIKNLFLITLAAILVQCDTKREAIGAANEITVIVDNIDQEAIINILSEIFTDTMYTPVPEPLYNLNVANPGGFNELKRHTNLIIGSLGAEKYNTGVKLVSDLLGTERFEQTIAGDYHVIFTKDQFARDQLFMILSAENEADLHLALLDKKEFIKTSFDNLFELRQKRFLFGSDKQTALENDLVEKYAWGMIIPWGWQLIKDDPENQFVWFGQEYPYRWISVHWEEGLQVPDSTYASEYTKNFPTTYYPDIKLNDYMYQVDQVSFNNWTAWKVSGLWESLTEAKGGPFLSYTFYDGISNRTYHLNMLTYYPSGDKSMFMRQLDLITHTFYVVE